MMFDFDDIHKTAHANTANKLLQWMKQDEQSNKYIVSIFKEPSSKSFNQSTVGQETP